MTRTPKILVWDVETSHVILKQWSLWDNFAPHENIVEDWYMICAAYKYLGQKRVHAVSVLEDKERFKINHKDDYHVIKHMHEVLSDADAIIHHYGDNFDIKKFNARAIYHGFPPLPDIIQIDTKKIASAKFKFTSNKLDFIGQMLGLGNKIHTDNSLWLRCEAGEIKAIREMVKYNKQDVSLLEKVYLKLAPYAPAKLNMNHFFGEFEQVCPTCGGTHLQRRGLRYTRVNRWQRFQCQECKSWSAATMRKDGTLGVLR